jgi:P27 family predicted phage terminase small subunit
MPKRGRTPQDPKLKILKETRPDRRTPRARTKPSLAPVCPFPLTGDALREWNRFAPILAQKGLLTDADAPAFAVYCISFGTYREAMKDVRKRGHVLDTDLGGTKANPATTVTRDALATMLKVLSSFGCTPVDRARLGSVSDEQVDPLEKFLAS